MAILPDGIVNGDPWRRLVAAVLGAIIAGGGPVLLTLWRGQSDLSERIVRLEEYRESAPATLATEVRLQDQRLKWLENNTADMRGTLRDLRSELQSISRQLEQLRRQE